MKSSERCILLDDAVMMMMHQESGREVRILVPFSSMRALFCSHKDDSRRIGDITIANFLQEKSRARL
jgi:hypothetical protein